MLRLGHLDSRNQNIASPVIYMMCAAHDCYIGGSFSAKLLTASENGFLCAVVVELGRDLLGPSADVFTSDLIIRHCS